MYTHEQSVVDSLSKLYFGTEISECQWDVQNADDIKYLITDTAIFHSGEKKTSLWEMAEAPL